MWTFNPESVVFTLAGSLTLDGFSEGTFINIEKDEATFSLKRVASGSVARRKLVSSSYTITLTISNGSKSNNILDTLLKMDILTNKAKFPVLVRDTSGSSFFFGAECWVEKSPELTYSSDGSQYTWIIRSGDGMVSVGGNEEISELEKALSFAATTIPYVNDLVKRIGG